MIAGTSRKRPGRVARLQRRLPGDVAPLAVPQTSAVPAKFNRQIALAPVGAIVTRIQLFAGRCLHKPRLNVTTCGHPNCGGLYVIRKPDAVCGISNLTQPVAACPFDNGVLPLLMTGSQSVVEL